MSWCCAARDRTWCPCRRWQPSASATALSSTPIRLAMPIVLAGREFADWNDLNQRAHVWCDQVNGTYKKHIRAVPRELFAAERPHLKPLPIWVPEVYRLHHRIVDVEGYVSVNTNRYSTPVEWIGRQVEVRESKNRIEIQSGPRRLVSHARVVDPTGRRIMLREH